MLSTFNTLSRITYFPQIISDTVSIFYKAADTKPYLYKEDFDQILIYYLEYNWIPWKKYEMTYRMKWNSYLFFNNLRYIEHFQSKTMTRADYPFQVSDIATKISVLCLL